MTSMPLIWRCEALRLALACYLLNTHREAEFADYERLVLEGPPVGRNSGRARRVATGKTHASTIHEGTIEGRLQTGFAMLGADGTTENATALRDRDLSASSAVARDWMAGGGFSIRTLGPSGRERGRPRSSATQHDTVIARLLSQAPKFTLEQMVAALGIRGSRPAEMRCRYEELARVVAAALSAPASGRNKRSRMRVADVANALGCSDKTVYKLREKGIQMGNKSPKEGGVILRPSSYWGFRGWSPHRDPRDPYQLAYTPPPSRKRREADLLNFPLSKTTQNREAA